MNVQQKAKGFTIIEVVLVLAIAGLIFLMVFIALPSLQRSQRDSARKNEASAVGSAIGSFMSNNRNAQPTAADIMQYVTGTTGATTLDSGTKVIVAATSYANGGGASPVAITAALGTSGASGKTLYDDEIKVWYGFKCGTANNQIVKGTTKQAAILVALESGPSTGSPYCQTN
ncbi:MAG: type II secretion system protein [Candidatus Saccharimonadales bacterium]